MGNCLIREKNDLSLPFNPTKENMSFLFKNMDSLKLDNYSQMQFFLEMNQNFDISLNFSFFDPLSPLEIQKYLNLLFPHHSYKKIGYLFGPWIKEESLKEFINSLEGYRVLNRLSVVFIEKNQNFIDGNVPPCICYYLQSSNAYALKEISFFFKRLDIKTIDELFKAVKERKSLEVIDIDLSFNEIGDINLNELLSFFELIDEKTKLKRFKINLSNNVISEAGLKKIGEALKGKKIEEKGEIWMKGYKFESKAVEEVEKELDQNIKLIFK